jgi:hypothetical protein
MDNGWIQLHRKLLDNPIYRKPAWLSVWVTLLLLASHKEKEDFIWNGKPIKLKKGEFITGRNKLSELTGVPATTIEDILKYLETQQQIRQQKTTKFRLISILKWNNYQKSVIKSDNRATTERQQSDTINKGNKENNDNNNPKGLVQAQIYGDENINKIINYLKEKQDLQQLDGSVKWNRIYAKNLLGKFKGDLEKVLKFITFALQDPFHQKNAVSIKYLYNNLNKIALSYKTNQIAKI